MSRRPFYIIVFRDSTVFIFKMDPLITKEGFGLQGELIVVKVGTSSLTQSNGSPDLDSIQSIVNQVAKTVLKGFKVVLVTSGAVAFGISELGVKPKPKDILFQQVSASMGQAILMSYYREFFKHHKIKVGQVLLSQDDLSDRTSYVHICDVFETLLDLGVVPIVNENDVTSTDELIPVMDGLRVNFSDNDVLSALIANALGADLLVILSDVDGLYTMNPEEPEAKLIPVVESISSQIRNLADGKSRLGRGGMKTKLQAAEIVTSSGIPLVIANSRRHNVLTDIVEGKVVGTLFKPIGRMSSRKRWIAYGASVKGQLKVNEGAKKAIEGGASLLPIGIIDVSGSFNVGDVIALIDEANKEFARGITNYTSEEINMIKGVKTGNVENVLGYIRRMEAVTRKYMYMLEEK